MEGAAELAVLAVDDVDWGATEFFPEDARTDVTGEDRATVTEVTATGDGESGVLNVEDSGALERTFDEVVDPTVEIGTLSEVREVLVVFVTAVVEEE